MATTHSRLDRLWLSATLFLLTSLIMESLLPAAAAAAEHIRITREVFIEGGEPTTLIRTRDGGYIILASGFKTRGEASATRVNRDGAVQWRHVVAGPTPGSTEGAAYAGAMSLPDDSVILCGHQWVGSGSSARQAGLITVLNKGGETISETALLPRNDTQYRGSNLVNCISDGDGAIMLGATSQVWGEIPRHNQNFGWMLGVDLTGKVQWEKLTSETEGTGKLLTLGNGALIVSTNGPRPEPPTEELSSTKLTRLNINHEATEQRLEPGNMMFVNPVIPDQYIRFMLTKPANASLTTWNEQLQDEKKLSGAAVTIAARKAYVLPDGSLALFGSDRVERNAGSASIQWLSAELNKEERVLFQPVFGSPRIIDAVPTGKSGEFATIRRVYPGIKHLIGPDELRNGMVLTFIQFN
jgi:hypothetical protein